VKRILLAGSTGCFRSYLSKVLQKRSCILRTIARNPEKLEQIGIEANNEKFRNLKICNVKEMFVEHYPETRVELLMKRQKNITGPIQPMEKSCVAEE